MNNVTIVITNYNTKDFIVEAIDSVKSQSVKPDKIVVVDDASTDGSQEILSKIEGIELILRDSNGGASSARNLGIATADTAFVALLDGDDTYEPEKIEKSLRVFEQFPQSKIGMVYSDYFTRDMVRKTYVREFRPAYDYDLLHRTCIANTNSVFLRSVFDTVGGFDENLRGAEDYAMWIKIAQQYMLYHIPEPLFTYNVHAGGMTTRNRDQVIQNTNRIMGALHHA
jgi:glycosyltransferase involved in cell wall biosynthesis